MTDATKSLITGTLREFLEPFKDFKITFRFEDPCDENNDDYENLEEFSKSHNGYLLDKLTPEDLLVMKIYPRASRPEIILLYDRL